MLVGSLRVRLLLREARSLKDKRQVIRSIQDRLRHTFNISMAEVDQQDQRQLAVLGVAMVGNEARHLRSSLDQVLRLMQGNPLAEVLDHEIEIW